MFARLKGFGRWALPGTMLLALAIFDRAFPARLGVASDEAVAVAQGGACSQTTDCSQTSFCWDNGHGGSIYFHYLGGGLRWYDPDSDWGLGKCRTTTSYGGGTCSGQPFPGFTWWICS
jgi:hypothetical protein